MKINKQIIIRGIAPLLGGIIGSSIFVYKSIEDNYSNYLITFGMIGFIVGAVGGFISALLLYLSTEHLYKKEVSE